MVAGQPSASFAELGVPAALLPVLTELGAVSPFPIQEATLPETLAGRDVLGRGKTGSGKTIAFAIPLVTRLTGGRRVAGKPRGLILLPTRELALQVARTVEPLAKAAGLRTVVIFGGVGYGNQTSALRAGVDIVIACPGRLEDLVNQKACDLSTVEVTVLDEADHMADLGFLPVVRRLLRGHPGQVVSGCCSPPPWTTGSPCWSRNSSPTRSCTPSTTRPPRWSRWSTTSSRSAARTGRR